MKEQQKQALIEGRLSDAEGALSDARTLLAAHGSMRGIMNRCYYTMFYAALALLQDIDEVPRKHKGVLNLFDKEYVRKSLFPKEMSQDFHKIFKSRQYSDYITYKPVPKDEVEDALRRATSFVEAVKRYFPKTEE